MVVRQTVIPAVCSGNKPPSRTRDKFYFLFHRNYIHVFAFSYYGVPSPSSLTWIRVPPDWWPYLLPQFWDCPQTGGPGACISPFPRKKAAQLSRHWANLSRVFAVGQMKIHRDSTRSFIIFHICFMWSSKLWSHKTEFFEGVWTCN